MREVQYKATVLPYNQLTDLYMLTELRLRNFKAWKDTESVRLAPITVFFGANSAGKTSLLQFLLMLKQTAESPDRRRVLHLGDPLSLVELGSFQDILHKHIPEQKLDFSLSWRIPDELSYDDPTGGSEQIRGDSITFRSSISPDARGTPQVDSFLYELSGGPKTITVEMRQSRSLTKRYTLKATNYKLTRAQGRAWELPSPIRFYGFPDEATIYFQNAAFVSDFTLLLERQLRQIYYLGPLRQTPSRTYSWSGEVPEHVGTRGERAIEAILAANDRRIVPRYRSRGLSFPEVISKWVSKLGLLKNLRAQEIAKGRKEFEVTVETLNSETKVLLPDVGFGVSQVLPVIVECFYAPPNSTVIVEQPELHLHPRVQSDLADLFVEGIKARENNQDRNMQFIIESHSEHFLRRLQLRVAQGELKPDQVAIYYAQSGANGATLNALPLNLFGEIDNWPEDFFGDEFGDIAARLEAASKKETQSHV